MLNPMRQDVQNMKRLYYLELIMWPIILPLCFCKTSVFFIITIKKLHALKYDLPPIQPLNRAYNLINHAPYTNAMHQISLRQRTQYAYDLLIVVPSPSYR